MRCRESAVRFQFSPKGAVGAISLPEVWVQAAISEKRSQLLTACCEPGAGGRFPGLTAVLHTPGFRAGRVVKLNKCDGYNLSGLFCRKLIFLQMREFLFFSCKTWAFLFVYSFQSREHRTCKLSGNASGSTGFECGYRLRLFLTENFSSYSTVL